MMSLLLLLMQGDVQPSTPEERTFCSGARNTQPESFCLADRRHERAERDLIDAMTTARRSAAAQKKEIARFSKANGGVTIAGDPVRALAAAQRAWTQSYQADCAVLGLADATGNGGTQGVTTNWECEADRIFDRVRFLDGAYPSERY